MALVSYDVSDASDSEEGEGEIPVVLKDVNNEVVKSEIVQNEGKEDGSSGVNSLFTVLPTPKSNPIVMDSDFSKRLLLNKPQSNRHVKKSVKIAVPALSELEEDLPRPVAKKITASSKGSGLFQLLPPPKNTGMTATLRLMPDSLKKVTPKTVSKPPVKLLPKPLKPKVIIENDEDDSDEETTGDFFSLSKSSEVEPPPTEQPVLNTNLEVDMAPHIEPEPQPTQEPDYYPLTDVPIESDNLTLDDEAIQKLCGGSKRKRTGMQTQLIDVAERDVVPDKDEWLMKALTEQKRTRSHKKAGGPSSQQKRKHHITYLAFQAKEQEQELQNQWANNKMTKKQTQSKYGF